MRTRSWPARRHAGKCLTALGGSVRSAGQRRGPAAMLILRRSCSSVRGHNAPMINIGIVDDHVIVRTGLKQFFSEQVDLRVVGEAASGREAIDLVRTTPE